MVDGLNVRGHCMGRAWGKSTVFSVMVGLPGRLRADVGAPLLLRHRNHRLAQGQKFLAAPAQPATRRDAPERYRPQLRVPWHLLGRRCDGGMATHRDME